MDIGQVLEVVADITDPRAAKERNLPVYLEARKLAREQRIQIHDCTNYLDHVCAAHDVALSRISASTMTIS